MTREDEEMWLFSADGETVEDLNYPMKKLPEIPNGRAIAVPAAEADDLRAFLNMFAKAGTPVRLIPLPVSGGDEMLFFVREQRGPVLAGRVERGAPPPQPRGAVRWPFRGMQVGDKAVFDDPIEGAQAQRYCHVFAGQQTPRWQFVSRTIDGAMHVWRMK